jgi:effector-binding domain-containing protein
MRNIFLVVFALFCTSIFVGCSSSEKDNSTSSLDSSKTQSTPESTAVETGKDVVGTSAGLLIREMYKNEIRVFGKFVNSPISKIKEIVNATVPEIMNQIHQRQLILGGTLMVVYPEGNPFNRSNRLFIGIPVKIKKPVPNFEYLDLPQGDYFKATINAEPGNSTEHWGKFLEELTRKGYGVSAPYYEYYSDSRNNEMATVLSQTSLLVKKQ